METGIHKHLHLLQLHAYLLDNAYIHPRNLHTRPAGLWRKLHTLYDLEALDEREDARQLSDISLPSTPDPEKEDAADEEEDEEEDAYSEAANKIHREEFSLPDDDGDEGQGFAALKWKARLKVERDGSSPLLLPEVNLAELPPAVGYRPSFSVEVSESVTPAARRAGRGRGGGRGARAIAPARRSRRMAEEESVAAAEAEQQEGQREKDEDEEGAEEEEEETEEPSEASTPARSTRSTKPTARGRGGSKARGARGRRRGR